jgi:TPR repeat protein
MKLKILLFLFFLQLSTNLFADYGSDMANKAYEYIKNKDYKNAKYYLEESYKAGNIWSKSRLGLIYLNGLGVSKDYTKARQYYEEAESYASLGWMYYTVKDLQNYTKAKEYFEKGVNKEDIDSKNNLALMYFRGQGVTKDYTKAKQLFEEVSDLDIPDPKNNLGWMYLNGYGVDKDTNKAIALFKEAANKDNIAANLNLAWIYKNGIGVDEDLKEGQYWQVRADELSKNSFQKNYELTYLFDAPLVGDDILAMLKKV